MRKIFLLILFFFINFFIPSVYSNIDTCVFYQYGGEVHGVASGSVNSSNSQLYNKTCSYGRFSRYTITERFGPNTGATSCPTGRRAEPTGKKGESGSFLCREPDNTAPSVGDIRYTTDDRRKAGANFDPHINGTFLMADRHRIKLQLQFGANQNKASISRIRAKLIKPDGKSIDYSRTGSYGSYDNNNYLYTYYEDFDFTEVSPYENKNNYASYKYVLEEVCDDATGGGNCMTSKHTIEFKVYANYPHLEYSGLDMWDIPPVAHGDYYAVNTIRLIDKYGNAIIPVRDSSGNQIRDITFELTYDNSLYNNQLYPYQSGIWFDGFYRYDRLYFTGYKSQTLHPYYVSDKYRKLKSKRGTIRNHGLKKRTVVARYENEKHGNGFYLVNLPNGTGKIIVGKFTDPAIFRRVFDGIYAIKIKSRVPTYLSGATDGRQYANGNFKITSLTVKLSDKGVSDTLNRNVDFQFRPRYFTELTGSLLDDNIVVGAQQKSNIILRENIEGSTTPVVRTEGVGNTYDELKNGIVYLEYGLVDETVNDPNLKHKEDPNFELRLKKGDSWEKVSSGYKGMLNLINTSIGNSYGEISTILYQKGTINKKENKTYLATIIKDSATVYPSFVLGMDRYHGDLGSEENTIQRSLKIIGKTHSVKYDETVKNEKYHEINTVGDLNKSDLKKHIKKAVSNDLKSINFNPIDASAVVKANLGIFNSPHGRKIGETLYFSNLNGKIVNISGTYSGVKNIVVNGGDVFINGDIKANNKTNDILAIIVLEDKGKGGNVFIHPNVTEIHSTIYADKSLLGSLDGKTALSPKKGGTYQLLKNQLYIFGSVFSNNTIGGSTQRPVVCPYFVRDCNEENIDEAQKYDLYYFRRGYENLYQDGKKPYLEQNLKPEYQRKDSEYAMIIEYNPLIQSKNLKFFQIKK